MNWSKIQWNSLYNSYTFSYITLMLIVIKINIFCTYKLFESKHCKDYFIELAYHKIDMASCVESDWVCVWCESYNRLIHTKWGQWAVKGEYCFLKNYKGHLCFPHMQKWTLMFAKVYCFSYNSTMPVWKRFQGFGTGLFS